ncbi:MAG: transcription-repair coupling factor [Myxococcota bacterium]
MSESTITDLLLPGAHHTVEDLPSSGLAYLLACAPRRTPLVVVTADDERAERVAADLVGFGVTDTLLFPGEPHTPFEMVSPDAHLVAQRLAVRYRLLAGTSPAAIVVSAPALAGRWMPGDAFLDAATTWKVGDEIARGRMAEVLVYCGYQPVALVEDEGTFAVRGSVVDVFPPGERRPLRIDLFGDDIAWIKTFEPQTQRTLEARDALAIYPIRETLFDDGTVARAVQEIDRLADATEIPTRRLRAVQEEIQSRHYFFGVEALWPAFFARSESVLETLLGKDVAVVLDDGEGVRAALESWWRRAGEEHERAIAEHRVALPVESHLTTTAQVLAELGPKVQLEAVRLADDRAQSVVRHGLADWRELVREIELRRKDASRGEILDPVERELRRRIEQRYEIFLTCHSRGQAERLRELLLGRKIDLPIEEQLPDPTTFGVPRRSPRIAIAVAPIGAGLRDEQRRVALLCEAELFGAAAPRVHKRQRAPAEGLSTLRNLAEGDLVVHVDHGVGRYLGLKRLIFGGVDGDYVRLEYADGDALYVPVYRLSQLQRYRGPGAEVRLDKLGGTRWLRAKQRVRDAVLAMAHQLLELQGRRKALPGFRVPEPDDHFRAFEATFPYDETVDQQRAIDDVLADLAKENPMDRLVCGDVGFGKTEVAIRAAFLTATSGRQVAVLVPTTVLAEQHGVTFRERLDGQPLAIEVLNRFRSPKETRDILQRTREGKVDILIGTHRLLSADVAFGSLGLLVVDEEQRFGVRDKERIKQLRSQVHVLTLSATPIPRTLHMAMVGLRDLSIIQTAPSERSAIRTEVTRFDEEVIAEAVRRELHRGGQVFVVHNRVRSIGAMADLVRRLVPEAKVAVGHGQMSGASLEEVMVDFVQRKTNVLVSTAIIESGLDIPSANTMIINRADTFGLAQLYQLRGRIGRGRERAHAYLLMPRSDKMTADATERLATLKRFSDLGSGFQIASQDLDLRGAGDLLGGSQSGHIAAVGFELYTELLQEAVERVRGQPERAHVEPELKLPVVAVLPESYIPEPMQRLSFYQRMAQASRDETIFDVFAEIEDLYGEAPEEARHLVETMVIRRRLVALGGAALAADVVSSVLKIGVSFLPDGAIDRAAVVRLCQSDPKRYQLLPSGRLVIQQPLQATPESTMLLRLVRDAVGALPIARAATA